jgi:putative addiction module antidote
LQKEDIGMITLKVAAVGNSAGVILPKEVLSRLKVSKGDRLFLLETPAGYELTPYDEEFAAQMRAAERVMKANRDVLRELAR